MNFTAINKNPSYTFLLIVILFMIFINMGLIMKTFFKETMNKIDLIGNVIVS
jgi:hypothetical protein